MRLTQKTIKDIPIPAKGYSIEWDDELAGFGLRTTANGVRAFIYNFRNAGGRQRRITLGKWPGLSATGARIKASDYAADVHQGDDPLDEKQTARTALTVQGLVDQFASNYLPSKKRGWEVELYLRRDFVPHVGASTKAEEVRRRDIIILLNEKAVSAPVAANRLLEAVRRMYNWALEQDLMDMTPCVRLKRPGEEKSRDRVLSEDEIQTLWTGLDSTERMSDDVRAALRLVLILATRPGEVCAMEWGDLDLQRGWWELPREKTKSDRVHRVALTRLALEQIGQRRQQDRWVFPSVKGQPLRAMALSHALRHNMEHFGLPCFRPHDLRRTAASHLASVGVDRFIVGKILGHSDRDVTGVYDRYAYDKEKRRAMQRWEKKLCSIFSGEAPAKVVAIDG